MSGRVVAIVQARTGSSRLPGKVLADIAGLPLIWHVLSRVRAARSLTDVVLATTDAKADSALGEVARDLGAGFFQGSPNDVLDRYYRAATEYAADTIVRITGDCPLIDPDIVDECIALFRAGECDYASNTQPPTYPDGLDVEVFSMGALSQAWKEASADSEREHVTPYLWKNPGRFHLAVLKSPEDRSHMRWIVDEPEDLEFVRAVYERLYEGRIFRSDQILRLLQECPELPALNARFIRNEGYLRSLEAERSC